MRKLKDYIICIKNVLSSDICDKIVNDKTTKFQRAVLKDNEEAPQIRKCYVTTISPKFEDFVFKGVDLILEKYGETHPNFKAGLSCEDTGYEHLLYKGEEKGEYKEHIDASELIPRVLSCSFLLNDNYEGGNLSFFEKKDEVIFPNKAGSAIVFPSNFCFPHAITPVSNGDRHAIITWIR